MQLPVRQSLQHPRLPTSLTLRNPVFASPDVRRTRLRLSCCLTPALSRAAPRRPLQRLLGGIHEAVSLLRPLK